MGFNSNISIGVKYSNNIKDLLDGLVIWER